MIRAADFLGACRRSGIVFFTGTPCSYMSPLFDAVAADDTVTFHAATNEGDAVAMAAGAYVATGRPGTVLFQNSGLGNRGQRADLAQLPPPPAGAARGRPQGPARGARRAAARAHGRDHHRAARPAPHRVWVADGAFHPRNLFPLVLDNEAHESTGGQATVSRHLAFGAVAQACGYARVAATDSLEELTRFVAGHSTSAGPTLVHFRVRTGALPNRGRPQVTPAEVKGRFMRHLHAAT